MAKLSVNVGKWGNGLAIRLPKEVRAKFNLKQADKLDLTITSEGFFLQPVVDDLNPLVYLFDITHGESVAIDPFKITSIKIKSIEPKVNRAPEILIAIKTKLIHVTVNYQSLLDMSKHLETILSLPSEQPLMQMLAYIGESDMDILKLWHEAQIEWVQGKEPMKNVDFLNRLSLIRNTIKLK